MNPPLADPDRIALGIQQPWAELILRGVKTLEVRSQGTRVRGSIYLYASKKISTLPVAVEAMERHGLRADSLQRGCVVGTVELIDSRPASADDAQAACIPVDLLRNRYVWELGNPQRSEEPLPVRFLPYGVWFYPWKRLRKEQSRRTEAGPDLPGKKTLK